MDLQTLLLGILLVSQSQSARLKSTQASKSLISRQAVPGFNNDRAAQLYAQKLVEDGYAAAPPEAFQAADKDERVREELNDAMSHVHAVMVGKNKFDNEGDTAFIKLRRACLHSMQAPETRDHLDKLANYAQFVYGFLGTILANKALKRKQACEILFVLLASHPWNEVFETIRTDERLAALFRVCFENDKGIVQAKEEIDFIRQSVNPRGNKVAETPGRTPARTPPKPDEWREAWAEKQGQKYFWNPRTGAVSWRLPEGAALANPGEADIRPRKAAAKVADTVEFGKNAQRPVAATRYEEGGKVKVWSPHDEVQVWSNGEGKWFKGEVETVESGKITTSFMMNGSPAKKEIFLDNPESVKQVAKLVTDDRPAVQTPVPARASPGVVEGEPGRGPVVPGYEGEEGELYMNLWEVVLRKNTDLIPRLFSGELAGNPTGTGLQRISLKQVWEVGCTADLGSKPGKKSFFRMCRLAIFAYLITVGELGDSETIAKLQKGGDELRALLMTLIHEKPRRLPSFLTNARPRA